VEQQEPAGDDVTPGAEPEHGDVSRETSPSLWRRLGEITPTTSASTFLEGRSALPADPGSESLPIGREAAAAVRSARLLRQPLPRPSRTRVIVVANQKGGVGKTTSAVNIAAALALHGAPVLLIDMDPQGNASTALGLARHSDVLSTYDVLVDGAPLEYAVQDCPDVPSLRGVASTIDLAGADLELFSRPGRELLLRQALADYLQSTQVDYVIVDCPPTLGLLTLNALAAGLEVLIPIQCEYYALEGLSQLLTTIDLVRAGLNPALSVSHVLLTMFDARTRLSGEVAAEVRSHFPDQVLPTAVPRSVRLSEAPGFGQTVLTYAPGSPGALSYLEAARDIARLNVADDNVRESA
jgi:chromosome partitioning protein